MKRNIKTVALFTVLSLMAVGCQKETIVEPNSTVQQTMSVRVVSYTIDGMTHHITIRGEKNWQEFIDTLLALAKEGHSVSFRNESANNVNGCSSKDVVTYVTNNEEDAQKWCNLMADKGYVVSMSYDERTGEYTCIAVK